MLIGDKYKIESDSLNVTLYRAATNPRKPGVKTWDAIGYFSKPQHALQHLVDLEVRETSMADLKTVCQKMEELHRLITTLKGLPELLESMPRQPKEKMRGKLHGEKVATAGQGALLT